MPVMIFWLILLIFIISSNAKKSKRGGEFSAKPEIQGKPKEKPSAKSAIQGKPEKKPSAKSAIQGKPEKKASVKSATQGKLKERQMQGYEKAVETDILERARDSVKEDFMDLKFQPNKQTDLEKRTVNKQMEQEKYMGEDSISVLDTVSELMVKGPKTELSFERDFLAEGIDMLNRYV